MSAEGPLPVLISGRPAEMLAAGQSRTDDHRVDALWERASHGLLRQAVEAMRESWDLDAGGRVGSRSVYT